MDPFHSKSTVPAKQLPLLMGLNLLDINAGTSTSDSRPEGCYYFNGAQGSPPQPSLWLNNNDGNIGRGYNINPAAGEG